MYGWTRWKLNSVSEFLVYRTRLGAFSCLNQSSTNSSMSICTFFLPCRASNTCICEKHGYRA